MNVWNKCINNTLKFEAKPLSSLFSYYLGTSCFTQYSIIYICIERPWWLYPFLKTPHFKRRRPWSYWKSKCSLLRINAPVTCRTAPGEYQVPVIPGSVIVNSGGTLMHLTSGKVVATLHRVNVSLIPPGESRVSLPFFLLPKMEGPLQPFFQQTTTTTGYNLARDRGVNAAVNRMGTFPSCTRKWWKAEYKSLRERHTKEVSEETKASFRLARMHLGYLSPLQCL